MTPRFPSDLGDPGRAGGHATDLTRMSELVSFTGGRFGAKRPTLLGMARLARCVHRFAPVMLIVVGTLLLAGCPPPPLSLDEPDARPNSPPGITSVRNETGVEFQIGEANIIAFGPTSQSTMTLSLIESDVEDTLYVRGFFDLGTTAPPFLPARAQCTVGPSTPRASERTVTCNLFAYCTMDDVPLNPHRLDVIVYDRAPDDAGDLSPPYYSVEDPGLFASRSYPVTCQESSS